MEKTYDVIIVGCGMAGALAGLISLRENLRVCVVERKKREFIGKKVCGELMPQKTLEWLKREFNIFVDYYPLKGLEICTLAGHRNSSGERLRIREPLCTIDRGEFGQTMVRELERKGADFYQGTVKGSVGESGIEGVKTKDSQVFYGAVTIDCSGTFSVLNKRVLTSSLPIHQPRGIAYKEDWVMEEPVTTEYASILLGSTLVPQGYMWCFPKNEYTLNTGAGGVQGRELPLRKILERILKAHGFLKVRERKNKGCGAFPLGLPLSSMVESGLLVCGDAARQINPLTGEGIAPALTAGYLAGKVAADAVRNNDTSVKGMWKYNCDFVKEYGTLFGMLFVLRDFLVSLKDDEMKFLMKLVTENDLAQLESGRIVHTAREIIAVILRGLRKPSLLYRAYAVLQKIEKIKRLYQCYPETPEELIAWQQELNSCLAEGYF